MDKLSFSRDELLSTYQEISNETKSRCDKELERINELNNSLGFPFVETILFQQEKSSNKIRITKLYEICLWKLVEVVNNIAFLSHYGLSRTIYFEIRYALEDIVRALYVDSKHPDSSLDTKIEILREMDSSIPQSRYYTSSHLIGLIASKHVKSVRREYSELSNKVHPTHKKILDLFKNEEQQIGLPSALNCEEISDIYKSLKKLYDVIFSLIVIRFPSIKNVISEKQELMEKITNYRLDLLSKEYNIKL